MSKKLEKQDWVDDALEGVPALVTTKEAMAVLRVSRRTFYRLVARGHINTVKQNEEHSGKHMVPRGELARYLRSLKPARAA